MEFNDVMPWGLTLGETGVVAGGIGLILIAFIMLRHSLTNAADIMRSLLMNLLFFILLCGLCGGVAYFVFSQQ